MRLAALGDEVEIDFRSSCREHQILAPGVVAQHGVGGGACGHGRPDREREQVLLGPDRNGNIFAHHINSVHHGALRRVGEHLETHDACLVAQVAHFLARDEPQGHQQKQCTIFLHVIRFLTNGLYNFHTEPPRFPVYFAPARHFRPPACGSVSGFRPVRK